MRAPNDLPDDLRSLVRQAVALLGHVIERELGPRAYQRIEKLRQQMASLRDRNDDAAYELLRRELGKLEPLGRTERFAIAHAFALMLELMNACENAYRAFRLRGRPRRVFEHGPHAIIYVLTAHPTEARSPANIAIFRQIQSTLVFALANGFAHERDRLEHLLEVAWRLLTARRRKPSVADEAEHIYSIALAEKTLSSLLAGSVDVAPFYLRSWVGGDKDGHPGIDEKVMVKSLGLSRALLARFARRRVADVRTTLKLLPRTRELKALLREIDDLENSINSLAVVKAGDGKKLLRLHSAIKAIARDYDRAIGARHPALSKLEGLIKMFPGLVMPLELRESSDIIVAAAGGERQAITRMLEMLATLAGPADPRWYARGFVISMASSMEHILAAAKLMRGALGELRIPIVPLFEQRDALKAAPRIVREMLRDCAIGSALKKLWDDYFEIMVGYSDSAKEVGVLASRLEIAECLRELDRILARAKATPVFFHGSGGSVDRGGGSIEEQTAWWPKSSILLYKATVQGEMVERTLASPEIARSGLERIAERATEARKARGAPRTPSIVRRFAEEASAHYRHKLTDPEFLDIIQCATAYRYLSVLRIGSRPAKRTGTMSVSSLRAIPWVLSWTQTRVLFPTWWGVGAAWARFDRSDQARLKQAFARDPLFRSYVKLLGFTLAKVELPVWRLYLERSGLDPAFVREAFAEFEAEYKRAVRFVRALSGERNLMWFRPWLGASIQLRSPMIHPLNLLQIVALQEKNAPLIRETVTGISSGMLTTG